jgi:hypothetical protein
MAVYVNDARIPAKADQHQARWSHLWADTQPELHAFAARLGLRRAWFQPGKPTSGQPTARWHYDVTDAKRRQTLALDAQPVPWRDSTRIMRARDADAADRAAELTGEAKRLDPGWAALWAQRETAIARAGGGTEPKACKHPASELGERLAAAGIRPDDPALAFWRDWNAAIYARQDADLEAGQ